MPALLTRMSSRPKRSTVCRTMSWQDAGSATSSATKALRAPDATSPATAASDFSRLRAAMTTAAPAAARPSAMPRPIPPLPPVTIATRPVRSNGFISAISRRPAGADQARAAIDDQGLAGDIARLVRQQEANGVADVPAEPLEAEHRGFAPRLAAGSGHLSGIHARGVDRAGRDAVDADAIGAVIDRHRPGQRDDGALRGRVGGEAARAQRGNRRHIDDGAALGG